MKHKIPICIAFALLVIVAIACAAQRKQLGDAVAANQALQADIQKMEDLILQKDALIETLKEDQPRPISPASPNGYEAIRQELERDNPIDGFYDNAQFAPISTIEMRVIAMHHSEAWKKEMLHAYQLLRNRAHPTISTPKEHIDRSLAAYLDFAEQEGWLEAYYQNSDAFGNEFTGAYSEQISTGTILPATASETRRELYRQQTIRIYTMLSFYSTDAYQWDGVFAFDLEQTKADLIAADVNFDD